MAIDNQRGCDIILAKAEKREIEGLACCLVVRFYKRESLKMKMKTKMFALFLIAVALMFVGTGCVSAGGSYQSEHHNFLANKGTVTVDSNGVPSAPINGQEWSESHHSWDINPLTWFQHLITFNVNNEVVVTRSGYPTYPVVTRSVYPVYSIGGQANYCPPGYHIDPTYNVRCHDGHYVKPDPRYGGQLREFRNH